jgi:hypothetical protein
MQKNMHKIRHKICKNMQNIQVMMQKNMQNMSRQKKIAICHEYEKKYAKYAKYVSQKIICKICIHHFADG